MKIRNMMTRKVRTVAADATLEDAARIMRDEDVGLLPVYEGTTLAGVVTDRDLVVRGMAPGLDPRNTRVWAVMTWGAQTGRGDWSPEEAAAAMERQRVTRLVVVGSGGALEGVLSLSDLWAARSRVTHHVAAEVAGVVARERAVLHA